LATKVAFLGLVVTIAGFSSQGPKDGRALLQRMREAYLGKWFKTVTFVQQTTQTRNGVTDTSTWYEALKSPDRLRIDFGDPKQGNGVVTTADSTYVVRGGKVMRTRRRGIHSCRLSRASTISRSRRRCAKSSRTSSISPSSTRPRGKAGRPTSRAASRRATPRRRSSGSIRNG